MAWAIFTSLASLASLVGLAYQLYAHKEKPLTYTLLAISIISSVTSAVLWVESNNIAHENLELKDARIQADQLVKSWPNIEDGNIDFVSSGELRGVVLSGMAFLEANKTLYPDTYSATNRLLFDELGVSLNTDDVSIVKRNKIQEAAQTMATLMKAIRLNKPT